MSVKGYADYEQLAGGVETLFKKSSKSVINNASKAYQTAGMSANEYMETVTGFSSALIQSTGRGAQTDLEALKNNLKNQYDEVKKHWQKRIKLTKDSSAKENLRSEMEEALKSLKKQNAETLAQAKAANETSVTTEESLARAAKLADQAIIDMSDNANKMGTDMASIQNAYQGFAKQNYTMLDNLKLGYGGTKEEMARLLRDAEKISGIKYDVSSYADIVDAIHVVQTEMHISGLSAEEAAEKVRKGEMTQAEAFEAMGTTAKEASTTIQGSLKSAKSAWDNLLTGLSDDKADIDKLINNFFDSVVTVGENIIPRIGIVLNGITGMIEKLAPKITAELPSIFKQILPSIVKGATSLLGALIGILPELGKTITKLLPDFIEALSGIIEKALPMIVAGAQALLKAFVGVLPQFVKLIVKNLPVFIKAVASIFKEIVNALPDLVKIIAKALPTLIPQIITALIDMVVYLMEHISEIIQPIIDELPDIIISIVSALMDNLPSLIDGVISLVLGIVDAIPQIILALLDALPDIIQMIIDKLLGDCLPQLIEGLIQVVMEVVSHIPEIIAGLLQAIPKVVSSIAEGLFSAAPKIWEAFTSIFSKAWDFIKDVFSNSELGEFFFNIFDGAFEGIKNAWSGIKEFFSGVLTGIREVFSGLGQWFKKVFDQVVEKIKMAWDGIATWFQDLWEGIWLVIKTPINWIIRGVNTIIDGLNMISIDVPDWVPLVGGQHWGFDLGHVPELAAKGGIVDKPTNLIAGEAGREAIIPLERNTQWIKSLASELLSSFYDGDNFTQTPNKGAGGKIVNINLYLDNVHVKNDDDIEDVANKVSERIAEKLVAEGMAVG